MVTKEAQPLLGYREEPRRRQSAWGLVLVLIVFTVGFLRLCTITSLARWIGDRQPTTGGFEFPASFNHVLVQVEGSDVGDCRVIADMGTSSLAHVVYSIESDRDDAQDETTVTAELRAASLLVKVWFPDIPKAKRLHSDVRITLPHDLLTFTMEGNAASLVWEAGNIREKLNVSLNVGSVRAYSALNTSSIDIETNVGSITTIGTIKTDALSLLAKTGTISLAEASVSGPVLLKSNTGSINGVIRNYDSLSANVKTGTIHVSLYPGVEEAGTLLKSKTGSVNANVYGFIGSYKAKTDTGSVKVTGNIHKTGANTGWVGSRDGTGTLDASTRSGSVDLAF
ncbi:hypothetical protein BDR26DRAFT_871780, partial [Obelidium mucronatum]